MAPHVAGMISHIAADLDLTPEQINIKAKTNERLGWEGRQEGIGAQAIVLIHSK
jgi:2-C-methyl-D-erythritol 2,4-cyclodiphosphate synthase